MERCAVAFNHIEVPRLKKYRNTNCNKRESCFRDAVSPPKSSVLERAPVSPIFCLFPKQGGKTAKKLFTKQAKHRSQAKRLSFKVATTNLLTSPVKFKFKFGWALPQASAAGRWLLLGGAFKFKFLLWGMNTTAAIRLGRVRPQSATMGTPTAKAKQKCHGMAWYYDVCNAFVFGRRTRHQIRCFILL